MVYISITTFKRIIRTGWFRNKLHLFFREFRKQPFRHVSFVGKQLPKKAFCKVSHDLPITVVHIAWCQAEVQDLPTVIDDKVEFETIEPSCRASAPLCDALKNLMLLYPVAVTYV